MDPAIANIEDPVSGERDPRVQHTDQQTVGSRGDAIYWQTKFSSRADDLPVSRWQEPVLILAEHALLTGDLEAAVGRITERWTAAARQQGVDRRFPISLRECTSNENVTC